MENSTKNTDLIKNLVSDQEIFRKTEEISKKFGLHIDQLGSLDAAILDIFSGHAKSKDFVNNIMENLEIERDVANQIAEEVNKQVFEVIKAKLQSHNQTDALTSLEFAGDFSVEKETRDSDKPETTEPAIEPQSDILSGIEDPTPSTEISTPKPPQPLAKQVIYTEPMVDHLLSNSTAQPEQQVSHVTTEPGSVPTAPSVTRPAAPAPKSPEKPKIDPYREMPQ